MYTLTLTLGCTEAPIEVSSTYAAVDPNTCHDGGQFAWHLDKTLCSTNGFDFAPICLAGSVLESRRPIECSCDGHPGLLVGIDGLLVGIECMPDPPDQTASHLCSLDYTCTWCD